MAQTERKPFWRDPILLIPVLTILLAGLLFATTWREFSALPNPPAPTATPTPRPTDPEALKTLQDMEAAMNGLTTLKAVQTLRDDSGHTLITTMLYAAPDELLLTTSTNEQSIVLGEQQWSRGPKDTLWQPIQRVKPFVFPNFHDYSPEALEVQFGSGTDLEGQPTRSVTFSFFTSTGPIAFEAFAEPQTLRFQRITMEAPGHHMVTDFVDYAPVVTVTAPPPEQIAPTATP